MPAPLAVESASVPTRLSDIELKPGLQVQVEHTRSRQRVRLNLIGALADEKLVISAPLNRGFARPGERLRIRLMSGNWICAFDAELLGVLGEPLPSWVLAFPSQIELARLREQTRLPITMRVRVDGEDPLEGPEGVYGTITDIHLRGASLETTAPIGNLGDNLFISTLIQYAGAEQLVLLPAKVVNQSQQTQTTINTHQYGLAFDSLDEETRVYLQGFIAQQMLETLGYRLDWDV